MPMHEAVAVAPAVGHSCTRSIYAQNDHSLCKLLMWCRTAVLWQLWSCWQTRFCGTGQRQGPTGGAGRTYRAVCGRRCQPTSSSVCSPCSSRCVWIHYRHASRLCRLCTVLYGQPLQTRKGRSGLAPTYGRLLCLQPACQRSMAHICFFVLQHYSCLHLLQIPDSALAVTPA